MFVCGDATPLASSQALDFELVVLLDVYRNGRGLPRHFDVETLGQFAAGPCPYPRDDDVSTQPERRAG